MHKLWLVFWQEGKLSQYVRCERGAKCSHGGAMSSCDGAEGATGGGRSKSNTLRSCSVVKDGASRSHGGTERGVKSNASRSHGGTGRGVKSNASRSHGGTERGMKNNTPRSQNNAGRGVRTCDASLSHDGAGYHGAGRVKIPNFELMQKFERVIKNQKISYLVRFDDVSARGEKYAREPLVLAIIWDEKDKKHACTIHKF